MCWDFYLGVVILSYHLMVFIDVNFMCKYITCHHRGVCYQLLPANICHTIQLLKKDKKVAFTKTHHNSRRHYSNDMFKA